MIGLLVLMVQVIKYLPIVAMMNDVAMRNISNTVGSYDERRGSCKTVNGILSVVHSMEYTFFCKKCSKTLRAKSF